MSSTLKSSGENNSQPSLQQNERKHEKTLTILGLGSLLSKRSAKFTFPDLKNFRLGRVSGYRRVFGHAASVFFERGIANLETMEFSSLSAEDVKDDSFGFICSVFEVSIVSEEGIDVDDHIPEAFREREEEFEILTVPFVDFGVDEEKDNGITGEGKGVLCTKSTDKVYISRWGHDRFNEKYKQYGIDSIWDWSYQSKLLPCRVYLRHCVLASKSMGKICYDSFLDETYLVDRKTTVRQYLESHPEVMNTLPPADLAQRYGG